MEIWKKQNLEEWKFGRVETRYNGNSEKCKSGNLQIRKNTDLEKY